MQNKDAPIRYYTDYANPLERLKYDYIELNYRIKRLAHDVRHKGTLHGSCDKCPKVSRNNIGE